MEGLEAPQNKGLRTELLRMTIKLYATQKVYCGQNTSLIEVS